MHSIHYVGPPVMNIQLSYQLIDHAVEKVKVNTSMNITYRTGTFQKNIEIDTTEQPVYISMSLRKFTGHTDHCRYGGLQMYHRVSMAVPLDHTKMVKEVYVPYKERESFVKVNKQHMHLPICINESIVFKRKFYLDFGITTLIFYGYSSMFEIDATLSVYPSVYTSLYNFEMSYCGQSVDIYIFKSLFINCKVMTIELKEQIPFTIQWSGDNYDTHEILDDLEWFWPGQMNMVIIVNYLSYVAVQRKGNGYTTCIFSDTLEITDMNKVIEIPLNTVEKTPTQNISKTESIRIRKRSDLCRFAAVLQYSVLIDPNYDSQCPQSTVFINYRQVLKTCVSLDILFPGGDSVLIISGAFLRYPYINTWVYYYLHVLPQCYQDTRLMIYYTAITAEYNHVDNFILTKERLYFTFYDYGIVRKLQFSFKRRSLRCRALFHMTEKPVQLELRRNISSSKSFKVCSLLS